jgi:hypothetical protein
VLGWPDAALLQVDLTVPPPTPAGRRRPPLAARIRACDVATGNRILDARVSLVGERARLRDPDAVPRAQAAPAVHAALLGRPLICWNYGDLAALREAVPHPGWPDSGRYGPGPHTYAADSDSTAWRAQLDDRRHRLRPARLNQIRRPRRRHRRPSCGSHMHRSPLSDGASTTAVRPVPSSTPPRSVKPAPPNRTGRPCAASCAQSAPGGGAVGGAVDGTAVEGVAGVTHTGAGRAGASVQPATSTAHSGTRRVVPRDRGTAGRRAITCRPYPPTAVRPRRAC